MQAIRFDGEIALIGYEEKYQISTEYPHYIRNRDTGRVLSISNSKAGHEQVFLEGIPTPLHKLIAIQFIENDDPLHKTDVLHINSNKLDNHINNLKWVTRSELLLKRKPSNKRTPEYLSDNINYKELLRIVEYNDDEFDRYYYYEGQVVLHTKNNRLKVVIPTKKWAEYETITLRTKYGFYKTYNYFWFLNYCRVQEPNGKTTLLDW